MSAIILNVYYIELFITKAMTGHFSICVKNGISYIFIIKALYTYVYTQSAAAHVDVRMTFCLFSIASRV